ncbi:hypothetical protein [Xylanibacter ruminicola]|uniref:hypothetical protein n=1 Tax=Xylanibacter ruminicola TaxID=839 RepID=UPI0012D2D814|nr:hypothetical protein [Xylanibacter ruminicola]
MNIKESVLKEIMNMPKQITCRYSNEEIEAMIRSYFEKHNYKNVASDFAFDIQRFEEEGVSKDDYYDLYFEIYTDRYYDEGKRYYYRFHIGRPYKKKIQELLLVTDNPSLEAFIAYKTIQETCVYISKQINPADGVFHARVNIALSSDIERILSCQYSKMVDKDFYLVDCVKVSEYLIGPYRRLLFAPLDLTLVI